MIHAHWTTVIAWGAFLLAVIVAIKVGEPKGDYDLSPLAGCAVFAVSLVVILAFLLAHAWGWL